MVRSLLCIGKTERKYTEAENKVLKISVPCVA